MARRARTRGRTRSRTVGGRKRPRSRASEHAADDGKDAQAYAHTEEKLLLRPDIGLQAQFRSRRPPKAYRYDPSLDHALSWDINADRGDRRFSDVVLAMART